MKTERFEMRFSPQEKRVITKTAKKLGLSMATYIRNVVMVNVEAIGGAK